MSHFKIDRSIVDHAVFAHPVALKIWIWCLSKATFKNRSVPISTGKGNTIVNLIPGQFIFGRFTAEETLCIDGSTIYRWIQKFSSKDWELITLNANNQYTVITICNWAKYQFIESDSEQPMNSERTANEPDNDSERTANEHKQEGLESKECKRRNKKPFVAPTIDEVKKYFFDSGYNNAEKFFNSYSVANWIDSKGKPVLNWKQKAINVWFTDQNKIQKSTYTPQQMYR